MRSLNVAGSLKNLQRYTECCKREIPMKASETVLTEPDVVVTHQAETSLESLASIYTVLAVGFFVMTLIFQDLRSPLLRW